MLQSKARFYHIMPMLRSFLPLDLSLSRMLYVYELSTKTIANAALK